MTIAVELCRQLLFATPIEPVGAPFAAESALLAAEEFQALEFIGHQHHQHQSRVLLEQSDVLGRSARIHPMVSGS